MKTRLFIMMFLEFFIWGAWLPLIFGYLPSLGFSPTEQSLILNAFPIAAIVGMFFSNEFADRNFAAEKFLAVHQRNHPAHHAGRNEEDVRLAPAHRLLQRIGDCTLRSGQAQRGFDRATCEALRTLGESVNYNAYGDHDDDCLMAPAAHLHIPAMKQNTSHRDRHAAMEGH